MVDQIKITETLTHLDKEMGEAGEPYVLGLPGNKRIVFTDFTSWTGEKSEQSEKLLEVVNGESDIGLDEFAEMWLSAKDFQTWKTAGLSFRQKGAILHRAAKHVLRGLEPGESSASSDS